MDQSVGMIHGFFVMLEEKMNQSYEILEYFKILEQLKQYEIHRA